ncbi:MAG TPA: J domain-containing protein, partial [Candidatus Eisenbacteria bacterium]|nr:J domain-containing protein [Candidatus Eisenbacteria bacterium]
MRSPYEVLGLRSGASPKEIQKSYRRLAKLWHPDRFPDAARRKEAEEKMRALNEAYRTLSSGETPPPVGRVPERQARPPRKSLWPGAAAALAAAAVLFAALYAFFHFREDAGKLIVNGVSFREWEWERSFRIGST